MLSRSKGLLIVSFFAFLSLFAFATVPQTFTGTVTDTMCGKKHMIQGKTDAACTRECMNSKGDWTYGLIVGDKVYRLAGVRTESPTAASPSWSPSEQHD